MHKEQLLEIEKIMKEITEIKSVYLGLEDITKLPKNKLPAIIIELDDSIDDSYKAMARVREVSLPVIIGLVLYDTKQRDQLVADGGILEMYEVVRDKLLSNPSINDTCDRWEISGITHSYIPGNSFDVRVFLININLISEYRRTL